MKGNQVFLRRVQEALLLILSWVLLLIPGRVLCSEEGEAGEGEEDKVKVIIRIDEEEIRPELRKGGGPLGLGIFVGYPCGVTAKYWLNQEDSIEFTLGAVYGLNNTAFGINYLRHFLKFKVKDEQYQIPFYIGTGMRLNTFFGYQPIFYEIGLKGVFGATVLVPDLPVDLFIEISPFFLFFQQFGYGIEGVIGMRYYY